MKLFEIPMVVTSLVGLGFLAGLDTPPARADFTFGAPVDLQSTFPFLNPATDTIVCFSADGLEMYSESTRGGGQGNYDLWVYKRVSVEDDWGPPENPGPNVNSVRWEANASMTADGLELYFSSGRSGGGDLYVARRATRDSLWDAATNLGPNVNSSYTDTGVSVSSDGLELYFISIRPGGYGGGDIYVSKRATRSDPWGPAANLGPAVNTPADEVVSCLSPDGLLLLFQDGTALRSGGYGGGDLWMTRRASRSAPWEPVVNLGPIINGPSRDCRQCLAPDGSGLYFYRASDNTFTSFLRAPILPIVDFNGDGTVDEKDLSILIAHWSQNYPVCDISPFAWGDGIVDFSDLKVLAEHMGKDVNDPTLLAHWKLDETEGDSAADSAQTHAGTVSGDVIWQPGAGKVGGALQFNGSDGFIATDPVCDPAAGAFTVFAWVKGGAPGQVILAQSGGKDWLSVAATGALATSLKSASPGKPVAGTTAITDGNWHRVGLSWDRSNCVLYVDDIEVARVAASTLTSCKNGLFIGAGTKLAASSFWSGLIDDVRIYSRAVQP